MKAEGLYNYTCVPKVNCIFDCVKAQARCQWSNSEKFGRPGGGGGGGIKIWDFVGSTKDLQHILYGHILLEKMRCGSPVACIVGVCTVYVECHIPNAECDVDCLTLHYLQHHSPAWSFDFVFLHLGTVHIWRQQEIALFYALPPLSASVSISDVSIHQTPSQIENFLAIFV